MNHEEPKGIMPSNQECKWSYCNYYRLSLLEQNIYAISSRHIFLVNIALLTILTPVFNSISVIYWRPISLTIVPGINQYKTPIRNYPLSHIKSHCGLPSSNPGSIYNVVSFIFTTIFVRFYFPDTYLTIVLNRCIFFQVQTDWKAVGRV